MNSHLPVRRLVTLHNKGGRKANAEALAPDQYVEALRRLHLVQRNKDQFRGLIAYVAEQSGFTRSMVSQCLSSDRVINVVIINTAYTIVARELGLTPDSADLLGVDPMLLNALNDAGKFQNMLVEANMEASHLRGAVEDIELSRTQLANAIRHALSRIEPLLDTYTAVDMAARGLNTHDAAVVYEQFLANRTDPDAFRKIAEAELRALKDLPCHSWNEAHLRLSYMANHVVPGVNDGTDPLNDRQQQPVQKFGPSTQDTESDEEYQARIRARVAALQSAMKGRPYDPANEPPLDPDTARLMRQLDRINSSNTGPDIAAILANTTPDPAVVAEAKKLGRPTATTEPAKQD